MNWICDPGHAWLKVKIRDVYKAGVIDKISQYSYMRGEYAYLEEDCDASAYLNAILITKKIKETHTNKYSRVRSYRQWSLKNAVYILNHGVAK